MEKLSQSPLEAVPNVSEFIEKKKKSLVERLSYFKYLQMLKERILFTRMSYVLWVVRGRRHVAFALPQIHKNTHITEYRNQRENSIFITLP